MRLSSVQRTIEQFLDARPFERVPWVAVGYAAGIAGWVLLAGPWQWGALLALCAAVALVAPLLAPVGVADHLRGAIMAMALMVAAGCGTIWIKSLLLGNQPFVPARTTVLAGRIVDRQSEWADGMIPLVLAARLADDPRPLRLRVSLPEELDRPAFAVGATITARARLSPPSSPIVPGAQDFAFAARFQRIAATGILADPVSLVAAAPPQTTLRQVQAAVHDHVLAHLGGSEGAIAATLASGDRGTIAPGDAAAMRDAGFAHLLAISGLHVGAVIAAVFWLVLRSLALIPPLALRVRLPVVAAFAGALAGIGYCLLTGSEVPTLRSVSGAVLALGALALGRDPLSMRLLAVAALAVMVFWPEAVVTAGFQMSFLAVMAVIAVHAAPQMRAMPANSGQTWLLTWAHRAIRLLVGGFAIEAALLPVALFHFHRAGLYGALANMVGVPLTTFVIMPAVALAMALDPVGGGGPLWAFAGWALHALLLVAHGAAALPGAATVLPTMPRWIFGVWIAGTLWIGLWSGRVRWWGLGPIAIAVVAYALQPVPDILISGDGRHVAITGLAPEFVVLDSGRGEGAFAEQSMAEAVGTSGPTRALEDLPGARCGRDFCAIALDRAGVRTVVLIARGHGRVEETALAAACAKSDIVIAAQPLPASCAPRRMRIDQHDLATYGGMTIDLAHGEVTTVHDASRSRSPSA